MSVRDKPQASREEMIRKQHAQSRPITFSECDHVMKRLPERTSKLKLIFFLTTANIHYNKF